MYLEALYVPTAIIKKLIIQLITETTYSRQTEYRVTYYTDIKINTNTHAFRK